MQADRHDSTATMTEVDDENRDPSGQPAAVGERCRSSAPTSGERPIAISALM